MYRTAMKLARQAEPIVKFTQNPVSSFGDKTRGRPAGRTDGQYHPTFSLLSLCARSAQY